MRSVLVGVILFASCTAISQVAESPRANSKSTTGNGQPAENDNLTRSVLRTAHAIANQLSPTDRTELLLRLARNAKRVQPSASRQWAMEALRFAGEMRSTLQRAKYEVQAINALASVDSEQALALLPTLEIPASTKDFDPRTRAAPAVFTAFMEQHPNDWERLSAFAQAIGETGNYPFRAIEIVVNQVEKKNLDAASALMQQAIYYYHRAAHNASSRGQFAALLAAHYNLVPGSPLKSTFASLFGELLNKDNAASGAMGGSAANEAGSNQLDDFMLALLMPAVSSVDPEMAQTLRQARPSVDKRLNVVLDLGSESTGMEGINLPGESITLISSEKGTRASEEDSNFIEPIERDTVQAFDLSSPVSLAESLEDSEKTLKKTVDAREWLEILVGRGVSLIAGERPDELANVLAEAFALGEKLFRKSIDEDRQASWESRPGGNELSTLVEAAARVVPQTVLERIRNVRTSVLQAQLYVSFAGGLQADDASPPVIVMRAGK